MIVKMYPLGRGYDTPIKNNVNKSLAHIIYIQLKDYITWGKSPQMIEAGGYNYWIYLN